MILSIKAACSVHLQFSLALFYLQVSISSILYTHIFLYKSALRCFSLVRFWLWQKDFGEKITFVRKTLAQDVDEIGHNRNLPVVCGNIIYHELRGPTVLLFQLSADQFDLLWIDLLQTRLKRVFSLPTLFLKHFSFQIMLRLICQ